jgi:hypothetical protein
MSFPNAFVGNPGKLLRFPPETCGNDNFESLFLKNHKIDPFLFIKVCIIIP